MTYEQWELLRDLLQSMNTSLLGMNARLSELVALQARGVKNQEVLMGESGSLSALSESLHSLADDLTQQTHAAQANLADALNEVEQAKEELTARMHGPQ